MAPRLQDKIALITGASSGIGREIALAYAREGAIVIIGDITQSPNTTTTTTTTLQLIDQTIGPNRAEFLHLDVTSTPSVNAAIATIVQNHSRLDILVNNAGLLTETACPNPIYGPWTDDTMDRVLDVNVKGVARCMRAASAQMVKQDPHPSGDRGWIVNLASVYGKVGVQQTPLYVASKHAVVGLTRAAAMDCGPLMVHVNAICPGFVTTNATEELLSNTAVEQWAAGLHPLRGIGKPEYLGGVAVFLASDDAKWMNGECISVDGGYTAQ